MSGPTWDTRGELAGREGLALLFLAEEGRAPPGILELSWRVGRGWPYYFLQRRGGRHMGEGGAEEEEERDTGLKSNNPNLTRVGNKMTCDFKGLSFYVQ